MKTSNKLLLILVALIITVPLLMMASFQSAISSNKFVVKNYNGAEASPVKQLMPFSVLKIETNVPGNFEGVNHLLSCVIKKGKTYSYKLFDFNAENSDSISVSYKGDTLVFAYANQLENVKREDYNTKYRLEITMPRSIPVIINKATVAADVEDAFFVDEKSNFTLANNASLIINGKNKEANYMYDSSVSKPVILVPGYTIQAADSKITFNGNMQIKNMNVSLMGASNFQLEEGVVVDTLYGNISDKSVISAPYNYIKKLKAVE